MARMQAENRDIETISLDELSDVIITSAATNDFLYFNGTNWVDYALLSSANIWTVTQMFNNGIQFSNVGDISYSLNPTDPSSSVTINFTDPNTASAIIPFLESKNTWTNSNTFNKIPLFKSGINLSGGRLELDSDANTYIQATTDQINFFPSGINTLLIGSPHDFKGIKIISGGEANFHFNPSNFTFAWDDFIGNSSTAGQMTWTATAVSGGTVAIQSSEGQHHGIRRLNTNTNPSGGEIYNLSNISIAPSGGDVFISSIRINPTGSIILRFGLIDSFTTPIDNTDGYYFEFDSTLSQNWATVTASGGTRTRNTSSTAVLGSPTWLKCEFRVNPANSQVDFYVNDVIIGSNITNLPGVSQLCGIGYQIQNDKITTSNNPIDIDYVYWYNKFMSR